MSAPVEEKIAVETGAEVPVEAPVAEPSKDVAMADDPDTDRKARARRQGNSNKLLLLNLY